MPRRHFVVIPARCCNCDCDKPAATAQRMLNAWGVSVHGLFKDRGICLEHNINKQDHRGQRANQKASLTAMCYGRGQPGSVPGIQPGCGNAGPGGTGLSLCWIGANP
jgi:hypothetical protein